VAINRDKILQEAQKLVDKKRYDKAIAEYQKVVADDPHDVRTLLKIGDIYLRMQQFAEAIASYDRVANHYSVQGFSVKAVAVYKQMREIIQKHAPHLEDRFGHVVPKLAELLTQLDLRSDALAYYDEMATRLQTVGRDRDAIDIFRKIVSLDGNNPVSHLRLADALARVRDFDGASIDFGIAAEILLRIGRRDDALRVVERLLQYRQESKFSRLAAQILIERNLPNDGMSALTKLQVAFKENPRDLETLGLLAKAFDLLGQTAKAVEVQKEAARIAREVGQRDVFDALMAILVQRAPNDEGVRQLVASADKPSSLPPSQMLSAPPSAYPLNLNQQAEPQQGAPARLPPLSALQSSQGAAHDDEVVEVSVVDEVSAADIIVDDEFDLVAEPPSEDDAPIPLRASHPPGDDDPQSPMRRALARAEAARRSGDYVGASQTLRRGIDELPQARELRERLCDVLIESGDQQAAVEEMLRFAGHLVEDNDPDAAARLLDEVLLLEPDNRTALEMLRALGYAVASPDEENYAAQGEVHAAGLHPAATSNYDPLAPLPSYDLEELTADELPIAPPDVSYPSGGYPTYPAASANEGAEPDGFGMIDPFGAAAPESLLGPASSSAPLGRRARAPSIELDDPFASESTSFGMPSYPLDDDPPAYGQQAVAEPTQDGRLSQNGLDEAALEEIEFFTAQGMLDEAEGLLNEQLARLPNHPILLERAREIALARTGGSPVAVLETPVVEPYNLPGSAVGAPYDAVAKQPGDGAHGAPRARQHTRELTVDRAYDIAHALDEMDSAMESFGPKPQQAPLAPGQISVEQVFEQFKAGVAAQIAEGDAATHYDLGVAYKEMGLLADAIHEFELASRDPTRECVCQSMIGMLHMQNGDLEGAIDGFIRGLTAQQKTTDQELALTYEIGNAYEMRSNFEQALYYFQLVARIDPSHRDMRGSVAERISGLERRIGGDAPKPSPKAVAVGGGDEFDAAFDDLFNPKR